MNGTYGGDPKLTEMGPGVDDPLFGFGGDLNLATEFGTGDALTTDNPVLSDLGEFTMMALIRPSSLSGSDRGVFGQIDAIEFGFKSRSTMQLWTATWCHSFREKG